MTLTGIGWNFAFIRVTAIITALHRPEEGAALQAVNEVTIYGGVAVVTLLSGVIFAQSGRVGINYALLLLLLFAILLFIILIKNGKHDTDQDIL